MSSVLLCLLAALGLAASAGPNLDALANAKAYAICQPGHTEDDLRAMDEMGVGVVVRGVYGAWSRSPEEAREGQAANQALLRKARDLGICFMSMISSSAIYEGDVPAGRYEAMVARDAHGEMIPAGNWHQGCLNNPEFRQYTKRLARAMIDGGADGIHYDESYGKWFWMHPVPGFCDHCCEQFRDALKQEFSADALRDEFGITDIDALEYRDYLAERGLADRPWESPLHDRWWLFQLDATARYEQEIVDDSKAHAASLGRDLVTNANQYDIATHCAALAMESRIYDHVNVGTGWRMTSRSGGGRPSRLRLPPDYSYVPMYRMARAMTPGKPVAMFLDIQNPPDFYRSLPAEQQGRVVEWLAAEAYSSGGYYAFHQRFSNWEGPRDDMVRVGGFFSRHHNRYFTGAVPEARVGVLYSYASYVWDMYPLRWLQAGPAHCLEYYGVCQTLLDANLQFDTVFMGDGRTYPGEQPDRLPDFDIVIVPSAYALTDANLRALAEYVANGGQLVVSGPLGSVDGDRRQRAVLPPELAMGHGGIHSLRDDYEDYLATKNPMALVDLADSLVTQLDIEPTVSVQELDADLQLTVRRHAEGDRLLIDVVNRDFEHGTGFAPSGDVKLLLTLPPDYGLRGKTIRALSPDPEAAQGELEWAPTRISRRQAVVEGMPGPMTIGSRAAVSINLPSVDVYTLVVIE